MTDHRGPLPPFILGWAGVIPFAALSAAVCLKLQSTPAPIILLIGYAVAILAFMSGVQWGLSRRAPEGAEIGCRGYAFSVVPALVAWACLYLPARIGLVLLAATFAALLAYDLWTLRRSYAPQWYGRLRWQLTCAVVVLVVAAAAVAD